MSLFKKVDSEKEKGICNDNYHDIPVDSWEAQVC